MPDPHTFLPNGRRLAAPSWVMPGTVAENCHFLAGKVDEVGLLFLETAASLAYTETDLPPSLASLPLSFHVHLPVDLPPCGAESATLCHRLMEKVAFLQTKRAVLHPLPTPALGSEPDPELLATAAQYLLDFSRTWKHFGRDTADILLENTWQCDLTALLPVIASQGFSLCLDTGHALAWNQLFLFAHPEILTRVRMVHCSAPGRDAAKGQHLPLTALSPCEAAALREMLFSVSQTAVYMLELFTADDFFGSLPVLRSWLATPACTTTTP